MPEAHLKRELGLRDLTLFAIAGIVGPRWISVAASAGPGSVMLWIGLGTNFGGMEVVKWTESLGGITSWMLGGLLVLAAAVVWKLRGSATPMQFAPAWNWDTLSFFGSIAFALSGMEVIGMMGGEI